MSELTQFPARGTVYDDYTRCTSYTRPHTPVIGQMIYETDTQMTLQYYGTGWGPIWSYPWGQVASTVLTTNTSNVGGTQDVLQVNPTLVANRRYRISAQGGYEVAQGGTGATNVELWLSNVTRIAADVVLRSATSSLGASNLMAVYDCVSTGVENIRLRLSTTGSNAFMAAATTAPIRLLVEDIGPVTSTIGGLAYPSNTAALNYTICTSITRPGTPFPGQQIFETDTQRNLVYQGSTLGWTKPWNQPWGELGYVDRTTNSSSFTTVANVLNDVTVTLTAGRRIRISAFAVTSQSAGGTGAHNVVIADNSNVQLQSTSMYSAGSGVALTHALSVVFSNAVTQSKTYRLRAAAAAASVIAASATAPAYMVIEDMGPG